MTPSENISKGKNTQHCEPTHTNYHHNYNRSDKPPIRNTTQNRDNYNIKYTPPVHTTTTLTAIDTGQANTAKQRGECDQLVKTELRDGRRCKGGFVWPSTHKRFPKPYDKGVAAVRKDGEGATKRDIEKTNEREKAAFSSQPSTSNASQ